MDCMQRRTAHQKVSLKAPPTFPASDNNKTRHTNDDAWLRDVERKFRRKNSRFRPDKLKTHSSRDKDFLQSFQIETRIIPILICFLFKVSFRSPIFTQLFFNYFQVRHRRCREVDRSPGQGIVRVRGAGFVAANH